MSHFAFVLEHNILNGMVGRVAFTISFFCFPFIFSVYIVEFSYIRCVLWITYTIVFFIPLVIFFWNSEISPGCVFFFFPPSFSLWYLMSSQSQILTFSSGTFSCIILSLYCSLLWGCLWDCCYHILFQSSMLLYKIFFPTLWLFFFFLLQRSVPLLQGRLLQGNEAGGVGGPDARSAVLHWLVGDGELAQLVASHHWLDFHLIEGLAILVAPCCPPFQAGW